LPCSRGTQKSWCLTGGRYLKHCFGYFLRSLGDLDVLVSRLETIYEDRFYLKL